MEPIEYDTDVHDLPVSPDDQPVEYSSRATPKIIRKNMQPAEMVRALIEAARQNLAIAERELRIREAGVIEFSKLIIQRRIELDAMLAYDTADTEAEKQYAAKTAPKGVPAVYVRQIDLGDGA